MEEEEEEISFSSKSQSYCVCFVSMVDSIEITFQIKDSGKVRRYYSIFINTMAAIARNFGANIIKNTGTSLVYFFPKTASDFTSSTNNNNNNNNESAFRDVIECGITMIAASDVINEKLREEGGLPSLYYRISADYGRVEVARSITSPDTEDLFGSTMNICSKINSMAPPNGMVIGSDLYYYYIARKSSFLFKDYHFKAAGAYSIAGFKHQYPVYSVALSKDGNKKNNLNLDKLVSKLRAPQLYTSPINGVLKSKNSDNPYHYQQEQQQEHQQKYHANILLVDDEPDTLLTYKTFLLVTEGYNVDAFTDSQKALQNFAQVDPFYYDLVVMDIRMPGLNGLQLYYRLKAMNPSIKVLFVSALDAAEEMVSILPGVKLGDVVQKPVNQEHFVNKVKTLLAQPRVAVKNS